MSPVLIAGGWVLLIIYMVGIAFDVRRWLDARDQRRHLTQFRRRESLHALRDFQQAQERARLDELFCGQLDEILSLPTRVPAHERRSP